MLYYNVLFQLLERPNDWGLDVFQLAEVVEPSRALGVLGFTLFKVGYIGVGGMCVSLLRGARREQGPVV